MKRKIWIVLGIMVAVPVGLLIFSDLTSNKSEFCGNVIQSSVNNYLLSRNLSDNISAVIIDTVLSHLPTTIDDKSIARTRMRSIGINKAGAAFGSRSIESALRYTKSDTALVIVIVKTAAMHTTVLLEFSCGSLCGESFAYIYLNLVGLPVLISKQLAAVM